MLFCPWARFEPACDDDACACSFYAGKARHSRCDSGMRTLPAGCDAAYSPDTSCASPPPRSQLPQSSCHPAADSDPPGRRLVALCRVTGPGGPAVYSARSGSRSGGGIATAGVSTSAAAVEAR